MYNTGESRKRIMLIKLKFGRERNTNQTVHKQDVNYVDVGLIAYWARYRTMRLLLRAEMEVEYYAADKKLRRLVLVGFE